MKVLVHAWYDPAQVNIMFCFSHLKERHIINYESEKVDAFLVHTKPGITKFESTPEVIYAFKPPIIYLKDVAGRRKIITSRD